MKRSMVEEVRAEVVEWYFDSKLDFIHLGKLYARLYDVFDDPEILSHVCLNRMTCYNSNNAEFS